MKSQADLSSSFFKVMFLGQIKLHLRDLPSEEAGWIQEANSSFSWSNEGTFLNIGRSREEEKTASSLLQSVPLF